jgi:hypothetical protein
MSVSTNDVEVGVPRVVHKREIASVLFHQPETMKQLAPWWVGTAEELSTLVAHHERQWLVNGLFVTDEEYEAEVAERPLANLPGAAG